MTKNYIAGEWLAAAEACPNINPSNTNDVVGEYALASATETERAIAAASDAFPAWSHSTIQARHDILKAVGDEIQARKNELGRLLSREEGKTLPEGIGEVTRAAQIFQFFAGECLRVAGEKLSSVRPSVMWRSPASRSESSGSSPRGQYTDGRRGLSRAIRRPQSLKLWIRRARPLCAGILYNGEDRLHFRGQRSIDSQGHLKE
ncbi:hypothetical protein ACVWYQ_003321 [Bradyrhizobium sp. USDA 3397]